ncbi:MAG: MFS transporter [Rhodocyclaceae bacterium]
MLTKTPANHPGTYFFVAIISMAGLSYINFLPGLVNALAGGMGFGEAGAGRIVALNGYGGLLGSIAAIFLVRRIHWRYALFAFLVVLTLIDIASVRVDDYLIMLALRFLAGMAGGLSIGIAFSVLARLDNPDRAFGSLLFVQFSIGALVIYALPGLEALIDAAAVFYVMAGLSLLSLALLLILPEPTLASAERNRPMALSGASRDAFMLLAALLLYQIAASAIWAYVGLIGIGAGIASDHVTASIAITGLLGLLGAMLPVVSGSRFGRLNWVVAGGALSIAASVLLDLSQYVTLYVMAMALLFFSWPAVQSYLLATTAEMDGSGRLSTVAAVVSLVGLATGPLLASSLLRDDGFSLLLHACALMFLLSSVLLFKPVQARDKVDAGGLQSECKA